MYSTSYIASHLNPEWLRLNLRNPQPVNIRAHCNFMEMSVKGLSQAYTFLPGVTGRENATNPAEDNEQVTFQCTLLMW